MTHADVARGLARDHGGRQSKIPYRLRASTQENPLPAFLANLSFSIGSSAGGLSACFRAGRYAAVFRREVYLVCLPSRANDRKPVSVLAASQLFKVGLWLLLVLYCLCVCVFCFIVGLLLLTLEKQRVNRLNTYAARSTNFPLM